MSQGSTTQRPSNSSWNGRIVVAALLLLSALLVFPVFNMYRSALDQATPKLVLRVMDTLEEYQTKHKTKHGVYATGVFDSSEDIRTITEETGWVPSLDEAIRYSVELLDSNRYQVIAQTNGNLVVSKIYPEQSE